MGTTLLLLMAVVVGAAVPLQSAVNAGMARAKGIPSSLPGLRHQALRPKLATSSRKHSLPTPADRSSARLRR